MTSACIEQLVRECETCQSVRNNLSLTLLHPWLWPDTPWKRLHVDFAGPFQGTMFMIIVDAHSKWLEVVPLSTTTTEKTLYVLCSMIARHKLPAQLVTDNGPQFISSEFETFMKENGIKHIGTSPYHPASNGEAERCSNTGLGQAFRLRWPWPDQYSRYFTSSSRAGELLQLLQPWPDQYQSINQSINQSGPSGANTKPAVYQNTFQLVCSYIVYLHFLS